MDLPLSSTTSMSQNGGGIVSNVHLVHAPQWLPRTPGMAVGLTDHVWTFLELLTTKFAPILKQSISG